jgi:antitoxin HicB
MSETQTLCTAGLPVAYTAAYREAHGKVDVRFPDLPDAHCQVPVGANLAAVARTLLQDELGRLITERRAIPAPRHPARRFADRAHTEQQIVPDQLLALKALLWDGMRVQGISNSALARHLQVDEKEVRRMLDPDGAQRRLPEAVEAVLGVQPAVTIVNASVPTRITGVAGDVPRNPPQDLQAALQVPAAILDVDEA